MTRKSLPRRTFLRGIGTTIALPLLDAMAPAFSKAKEIKSLSPCRMAFAYVPNGMIMENWIPALEGSDFEIPPTLQPLAAYRDDWMVLSGLTHNNGRSLGDGPGDHARSCASYLTGVHPKKTPGADIRNGISVDQVAAMLIGQETRFGSLELGTEEGRTAGACDSGYSCAYNNSISWRSETTPLPPEIKPRLIFERLFGAPGSDEDPITRAKWAQYDKSILDFVQEDTHKLKGDLGTTDRRKLDEYLTAIRDIEKRISMAEQNPLHEVPSLDLPEGVPVDFVEHVRLMFDLQILAFRTDLTRITTFMLGLESSNRTYREIDVPEAHHGLTHHLGDERKIREVSKINRHHAGQFAYFLEQLKSTPDGDGSLLDHSIVVYGSSLGDGNRHDHHNLPVLVAGRACGGLRPRGQHIRYPAETPMTNLFLVMLDLMGIHEDSVGDSTGRLDHLTDL
ncbi:MAG: DUF1552 domain-containing protein [Acidobacteria bacterium]|nr:DUF1552 domain-containing protein [Acidobacteriota bacterium]